VHASAAPAPSGARRLLLDHVAYVITEDGTVELSAPAGGSLDGLVVGWTASGGQVSRVTADGTQARLTPTGPGWDVQASLMRNETALATARARAPDLHPVAAASPSGALIRWSVGPPPTTTVDGTAVACEPVDPGLCLVSAKPGVLIAFEGGVVTAGAAPGSVRVDLEESPDECGDARFPAPVGGGVAGCSAAGVVDRHRRGHGAPRRVLSIDGLAPAEISRTSVTADGAGLAVVQGRHLGLWSVGNGVGYPSPHLDLVSPPGSDGEWLALPLRDRLQITRFGASQRRQLPATPTPSTAVLVAGPWVSWRDTAARGVQLASTGDERLGTWPGTTPDTMTLLSPGWLVLSTEERTTAWGLGGQPGWTRPGDHAFGASPVRGDDYVALPSRDGGAVTSELVHLPTGISVASWGSSQAWVVPRGADASGIVVQERAPGETGLLVRLSSPIRVFEEHGALGLAGAPQSGGHGGRHQVLAPGEQADARLRCDAPSVLRAYRPDGPADGAILVTVAGTERRYDLGGTGWVDVARLPRDTDVSVRFVADPDGDGLVVDALMLEAGR